MNCLHHLAGGPLVCVRTDEHDPDANYGHVYHSTLGDDGETVES